MTESTERPAVRLDVWLWAARFFKTRALAKQAVESGKIDVETGSACKPGRAVRSGDRFSVRRGVERFDVEVLAVAAQRGPASVAQTLYRESEASIARRAAEREQQRLQRSDIDHPAHRPNKKARRQIRGLPGGKGPSSGKWPPWMPE